jgi:8-oxo-dGTP diphosphatase
MLYDSECQWWLVNELPPLMFDHKYMISEALRALRMHIAFFPIGYELLPENSPYRKSIAYMKRF